MIKKWEREIVIGMILFFNGVIVKYEKLLSGVSVLSCKQENGASSLAVSFYKWLDNASRWNGFILKLWVKYFSYSISNILEYFRLFMQKYLE